MASGGGLDSKPTAKVTTVCEQFLISHDWQTAKVFGAKQETICRNFSVRAGKPALAGEIVLLNSTA
jgi:hypothetical protein